MKKEEIVALVQNAVKAAEVRFEKKLQEATTDLRRALDEEKGRCNELKLELEKTKAENNRLEQYSRRSHLRIQGLELPSHKDCKQAVAEFISNKLTERNGTAIKITRDDLDAAHPLPTRPRTPPASSDATTADATDATTPTKTTPAIIVRFHQRELRDKVIRARRCLKKSGITIQEDLTAKNAKLLKEMKSDIAYSSAWTWEGKVYALPKGQTKPRRISISELSKADE